MLHVFEHFHHRSSLRGGNGRARWFAGGQWSRRLLIQLNRAFSEINVVLAAIAIGLTALDYLLFLRWEIVTALLQ